MASASSGIHSRRVIEQMIRAYCGEKIGIRDIKKGMSCGMLKAVSYRNMAYDLLDHLHAQSMDVIEREMDRAGLRPKAAVI